MVEGRVQCVVNVDYAMRHVLNDMASLSRAELAGEKVLEHCIYRYFGGPGIGDLTAMLGYGPDQSYLSDAELECYLHDVTLLNQVVDNLLGLLDHHLKPLLELQRPPINVNAVGLTAYIKF